MNGILYAEVILTLTADQARGVLDVLEFAVDSKAQNAALALDDVLFDLVNLVVVQCARQGVAL